MGIRGRDGRGTGTLETGICGRDERLSAPVATRIGGRDETGAGVIDRRGYVARVVDNR